MRMWLGDWLGSHLFGYDFVFVCVGLLFVTVALLFVLTERRS